MASPELEVVVNMLRAAPALAGATIHAQRENMERIAGALPRPEGVAFEAVDAEGVPAEWATPADARADRVIVYFHGGGYCIGSLNSHRGLVARLAGAARCRVLSVDYRLAPEHPHPAAVEDALAAWRHVLGEGIAPERAAFAGDSAGGGLTVAALVAARDAGLPLPAAGACISPWLDLTLSGGSIETRAALDPMIPVAGLRRMAEAYAGTGDPRAPTASPLFADLRGLPPLLLQVGTAEVLLDDSRELARRARAAGVDARLEVWEDMIHVWHAFADLLPEARQAIAELGAFVDARWR